jgi:uncharacterized protein (TIGR00369 family)
VSAREELLAALDDLSEQQARTVAEWVRTMRRDRKPASGSQSVGPLADALGIVNEVQEPGHARMRLEVDSAWHNPNGTLHGGVIYTLIDYSMGGAVQVSLPPGEFCTSIDVTVSYLAAVRDGTLTVETQVLKQGRNVAFTESKVTDGEGRLVATGSGSMFILRPEA